MNDFNEAYKGLPPWDIGQPQPEFVRLADEEEIKGSVLDVGCGTGEHVLHLAALGLEAWGVDSAPLAIKKANEKAQARGIRATFLVRDAMQLSQLGRKFDTIIDCGLFHVFSDEERPLYAKSLRSALKPNGTYLMMCFSDREPPGWGPRRVTQEEVRATFEHGWKVNSIREAEFRTNDSDKGVAAWLCSVSKVPTSTRVNGKAATVRRTAKPLME
jgi:cyclopropane fatty-acyl-phospholipid synthase-like methyltransferase